jgi:hypothetical protein
MFSPETIEHVSARGYGALNTVRATPEVHMATPTWQVGTGNDAVAEE